MDPNLAARMFEPFQSGFAGGTGLGLAIVYQILQAHKGKIRVETRPGRGSEFIVDLPRVVGERGGPRQKSEMEGDARARASVMTGKA